jgi:hypothetical protein
VEELTYNIDCDSLRFWSSYSKMHRNHRLEGFIRGVPFKYYLIICDSDAYGLEHVYLDILCSEIAAPVVVTTSFSGKREVLEWPACNGLIDSS